MGSLRGRTLALGLSIVLLSRVDLRGADTYVDQWYAAETTARVAYLDGTLHAGVGECAGDCCADACDRWYLFPQHECGMNVRGWLDGGFIGNTSSPDSKFNGPYNAVDRSNEGMFNQAYLIAERDLPAFDSGLGFRFDLLYGEYFFLAESIGM
jgi:hypothetical protein